MADSAAARAEVLYQRARDLHRQGELDQAIACYEEALDAHAKPADVSNDLGVALRARNNPHAAIALYERALSHDPNAADTWSNLGNARLQLGQVEAAVNAFRTARTLDPNEPDYMQNLGAGLRAARSFKQAEEQFEAAASAEPDRPAHQLNLGMMRLHQGKYRQGFEDYEARLQMSQVERKDLEAPLWDGGDLDGRTLLVHAEQGLGDTIQFSRFLIPLLERVNGSVVGEVYEPLLRLFRSSFPLIEFVGGQESPPRHDVRVSIPSLPYMLGVDAADLVPVSPYLQIDQKVRERAPQLPGTGRLKVGLTWAGKRTPIDRSCPFPLFLELAGVAGIDLYTLQRGDDAADIARHGASALIMDVTDQLVDFADDAAIMAQLDLMISIDTSICHLAGALDSPCWTLLTGVADWRFLDDQTHTPWYPGMRLFRGAPGDDWGSIVAQARDALRAWVRNRASFHRMY